MDATRRTNSAPPARETLGDILYADKASRAVSEEDWAKLVQSIAVGDQRALHELYERTHPLVFTLIVRITNSRETAEELTVDVFHEVWRRAPSYDADGGTVLGWIMNQARSRAIDRLRFEGRKKRVRRDFDDLPETVENLHPHEALELVEQRRLLLNALAVLTPDERQAIEIAYLSDLTYAETAERLNQPLGTVKTRIRAGLKKLRQALGGNVRTL